MKSIIAVSLFAASAVSSMESWEAELDLVDLARWDLHSVFSDWKSAFSKEYESIGEEYKRFTIWVNNLQRIAAYNSDSQNGARLRTNQFGDWTDDEFHEHISCLNTGDEHKPQHIIGGSEKSLGLSSNPSSVDWTKEGVVTPVKNQGQCGSCWAFSTTGAIECNYAINHGQLNSLSEQQLVDCTHAYGNLGCSGGSMDASFRYVANEGGLCSESEYPYKARGGNCEAATCGTKYDDINGHQDVTSDSESSLETAVAAGCVSVAIEADQFAFQYYSSGVLTGDCGTNLDHGVLVVGYGSTGGQEYWKVKNSWGLTWGEQGYVLICKDCGKNGKKGECGILMEPSYPTV